MFIEYNKFFINGSPTSSVDMTTTGLNLKIPLAVTGLKSTSNNLGVYCVMDSATASGIEIVSAATDPSYIDFSRSFSDFRGRILYNNPTDTFTISTAGSTAMMLLNASSVTSNINFNAPHVYQSSYGAFCRYTNTANLLFTDIVIVSQFVNINSQPLSSISLSQFNINGNNGVTYTGVLKRFLILYSVSVTTSTA